MYVGFGWHVPNSIEMLIEYFLIGQLGTWLNQVSFFLRHNFHHQNDHILIDYFAFAEYP